MPKIEGETDQERDRRGSYYAIIKRIEHNKEFFEAVWEIQPKFMAIFGRETENIFHLLHTARRDIEVACEILAFHLKDVHGEEDRKQWVEFRRAIWSSEGATAKEGDNVGTKLEQFRTRIEELCRPVIDKEFKGP
jgi:hypothetical protein